jgi:hypothetical protein
MPHGNVWDKNRYPKFLKKFFWKNLFRIYFFYIQMMTVLFFQKLFAFTKPVRRKHTHKITKLLSFFNNRFSRRGKGLWACRLSHSAQKWLVQKSDWKNFFTKGPLRDYEPSYFGIFAFFVGTSSRNLVQPW